LVKIAGVEVTANPVERLTHAFEELVETEPGNQDSQFPSINAFSYSTVDEGIALTAMTQERDEVGQGFQGQSTRSRVGKAQRINNKYYYSRRILVIQFRMILLT